MSASVKNSIVIIFAVAMFSFQDVYGQNYVVNSNGDTHAANPAASALDAGGNITMRSAMEASTAIAGTHVITIPASITVINLTLGQITVGSAANGNNITLNGPGKALLTINQTTANRIFSTGSGAITFLLTALTLNYSGPSGNTYSGGGGAIIAGGINASTTLTNVAINNFKQQIGNGGALSASTSNIHNLTLTNCDFTNNQCGGSGGAVSYNGLGTCTITNCTFTNNATGPTGANTGGSGGAVATSGLTNGGNYSITNCTFVNNKLLAPDANIGGGAISNTNGALTVNFCRFSGNTAATPTNGNTIAQIGGSGINTTNADNNWWGKNAPDANDKVVVFPVGTITCTKWIQLKLSAAPSPVCLNTATTVTASFLSNSNNETLTSGNVSTLIGLPISFVNPVLGTLSAPQATIQANGKATVTYTAGNTSGSGSANGVVDAVPNNDAVSAVTIPLSVTPSITGQPAASSTCLGLPITFTAAANNQTSVAWQESSNAGFTTPTTLTNTGIYSGTTTNTLTISDNTLVNGKYYRMVATNSNGCGPANSNGAMVTANAPTLSGNETVTQAVNTANNLYFASGCRAIAKVVPSGASPVLGNVTAQVWVEATVPNMGGDPFVQRHYQVMPAANAATATGTITLYFSQAEFDNFNADPGSTFNLPTGSADALGKSNLRIAKYTGASNNGSGMPNSYTAGGGVIDPPDNQIVWNTSLSRWEVTLDVTGFSGFIIQTSPTVLPLQLISFSGSLNNSTATLQWKIATAEDGNLYALQRGSSITNFHTIYQLAGDRTTTTFSYNDVLRDKGIFYYRLQITDRLGNKTYSNLTVLKTIGNAQSVSFYPNPVKSGSNIMLMIENMAVKSFEITTIAGQVIYRSNPNITGTATIPVPVPAASGLYLLKISTGSQVITQKMVVQ